MTEIVDSGRTVITNDGQRHSALETAIAVNEVAGFNSLHNALTVKDNRAIIEAANSVRDHRENAVLTLSNSKTDAVFAAKERAELLGAVQLEGQKTRDLIHANTQATLAAKNAVMASLLVKAGIAF